MFCTSEPAEISKVICHTLCKQAITCHEKAVLKGDAPCKSASIHRGLRVCTRVSAQVPTSAVPTQVRPHCHGPGDQWHAGAVEPVAQTGGRE